MELLQALCLGILCTVAASIPVQNATEGDCENYADVVFLLDSSGSIPIPDFSIMLDFVESVVQDLGNNSRFGLLTFSHDATNQFDLNTYDTVEEVVAAIDALSIITLGTTNTAAGLEMTRQMFTTARGDRDNVTNVAIVLTDGNSNDNNATLREADLTKQDGIRIISIGIGPNVDNAELEGMASHPHFENVFTVDSFDALETISYEICQNVGEIVDSAACDNVADLVFVMDRSGSIAQSDFEIMRAFVEEVTHDLGSGGQSKFGLLTYSDNAAIEFHMNTYSTLTDVLLAIDAMSITTGGTTNTADALAILRSMYTVANGERADVVNVAIVLTDGHSNDASATVLEANEAKRYGIRLITIGIGPNVDQIELEDIASVPKVDNMFTVDTFDALEAISGEVCDSIGEIIDAGNDFDCLTNNPCIDSRRLPNLYFYAHANANMFIQCSPWGQCFEMNCPGGLEWDQQVLNCLPDSHPITYNCANNVSPCNPLLYAGDYYYQHDNPGMFVQCDAWGSCFDMHCPGGLTFDDAINVCT